MKFCYLVYKMFENVSPDLVGPTGPVRQILVSGQETYMPSPVKPYLKGFFFWNWREQKPLEGKDFGPIAILWQLAAAHHSAQWGISFPITWFYWNSWPWNLDRFSLCMFNLFMRLLGGWIGLKRSKSSYIWSIFLMLTIKIEQL